MKTHSIDRWARFNSRPLGWISLSVASATLGRIPLLVYFALDVGSADQSRLRLGPTEFLTKSRCSLADFERYVVGLLETVTHRTKDGQRAA